MIGMLLVSPITWAHYLVLLFVPMVLLAPSLLAASLLRRGVFVGSLGILWLNAGLYWRMVIPELATVEVWHATAKPWQILTGISLSFYALLAVFGVAASVTFDARSKRPSPEPGALP